MGEIYHAPKALVFLNIFDTWVFTKSQENRVISDFLLFDSFKPESMQTGCCRLLADTAYLEIENV